MIRQISGEVNGDMIQKQRVTDCLPLAISPLKLPTGCIALISRTFHLRDIGMSHHCQNELFGSVSSVAAMPCTRLDAGHLTPDGDDLFWRAVDVFAEMVDG